MLYFLSLILGLIIGSFLNVLIYRTEKNLSLGGRSFCPRCKKQLFWYDNIPLFSYLWLGGRCRFCHKKISVWYPIIEMTTGLIFLESFFFLFNNWWNNWLDHYFSLVGGTILLEKIGWGISLSDLDSGLKLMEIIFIFLILAILFSIFVYDLKYMMIPDYFSWSGIAIVFVYNLIADILLLVSVFTQKNQLLILKIKDLADKQGQLTVGKGESFLSSFGLAEETFYAKMLYLKSLFSQSQISAIVGGGYDNLIFAPERHPYFSLFWQTRMGSGFLAGLVFAGFFFFLVWVSKETWMGKGDIKLAFLLGFLLGFIKSILAFMLAFELGAIVGIGLMVFGRAKMKTALPLGPFLILGAVVTLFLTG